ncbi:MAG TPA: riboflavin synthase [Solirubrobacterales bacterium]|nr:riboflavin synthase [Solirubrobacterales bacterium]
MFTGLIEDVGRIELTEIRADGHQLMIETKLASSIAEGGSIAVNGVCLTATRSGDDWLAADVMNQTLRVTALGQVNTGDRVNLELAMKASDRLDGHIVQGHVDGVGKVISVEDDGFAKRLRVGLEPALLRYVIDKGSIALEGVSLTVAELGKSWIEVSLIPETLERTTLGEAERGRKLNVECDVIAKHVERLMAPFAGKERA